MSTRRQTRAASRQSSRGITPSYTGGAVTPSTINRRAGPDSLPAVNLRSSTAYGEDPTFHATARASRHTGQGIEDVIGEIIPVRATPVRETPGAASQASRATGRSPAVRSTAGWTRGRPSRQAATPVEPERSFGEESNLFGRAGFDTSSVNQPSDIGEDGEDFQDEQPPSKIYRPLRGPPRQTFQQSLNLPPTQHQAPRPVPATPNPVTSRSANVPKHTSPRRNHAHLARPVEESWDWQASFNRINQHFQYWWAKFREALQEVAPFAIKFIFGAMLTIFIITTLTPVFESKSHRSNESDSVANDDYEKGYQYYGFDIRHNIGQFIPNWVAHPVESFTPDVISDIQHKIRDLDYKYSSLKRKTDLDGQTISKIEKSLPNFLVVKKNKNGKTEIPYEFWAALRDLIQSDDDLLQNPTSSAQESSGQGLLAKEIEKKAGRMWDKYIKENQAKLSFEEKFPHLFKKNILASKPEIIDMIRHEWEDKHDSVKQELAKLTKKLEKAVHDSSTSMSHENLRSMISRHIHDILPVAQLEALIRANVNGNANWGLTRVNHWSHGTGAVVDIITTSPSYAFPSMNQWFYQKAFRWAIGNPVPAPNPPEAALTKWDEHGDCWCAPSKDDTGFGPAIGVISGSSIYPDQVVVEHIAASASLEPGAAPKDMELFAYIPDFETYDAITELSKDMFGDPDPHINFHYVKVAEWTFKTGGATSTTQAFNVGIDLRNFDIHTNKLVVRAKNNWGGGEVDYTCFYRIRVHGDIAITPGP